MANTAKYADICLARVIFKPTNELTGLICKDWEVSFNYRKALKGACYAHFVLSMLVNTRRALYSQILEIQRIIDSEKYENRRRVNV